MPELPEVQTVVDDLNKKIKGHIVVDFWSDWPKAIKGESLKEFRKVIKGRKILGARRIGKNIFIDLSGGKTLYIHLKMTGHLLVKSEIRNPKSETISKSKIKNSKQDYFADKVNQYIHHIFYLKSQSPNSPGFIEDSRQSRNKSQTNSKFQIQNSKFYNKTLEFSDVRKFAKIVLDSTEKINNLKEVKKLGMDAMSSGFTLEKFKELLAKRGHRKIGEILVEQELIAGIGNIYRSEILFEAGILPTRIVEEIGDEERKNIYKTIKKVLKKAIKLRGTSDSDYRDTAGAPGNFQKVLKVYRRAGKKCPKCGTLVKRIILGQRSVFYCPKCQK